MSAERSLALAQEGSRSRALLTDDGHGVASHIDRAIAELDHLRALMGREGEDHQDRTIWDGVASIQEAIGRTRAEIGSLHSSAVRDQQFNRVTDELDAVVGDTESATNTILTAAEAIDDLARKLMKELDGERKARVAEIHAHAVTVFEACNFQDITGQRISKVVGLMQFVEGRIGKMLEIWSGVTDFANSDEYMPADRVGDAALLNGPALVTDSGVVSQDDIDSLFA